MTKKIGFTIQQHNDLGKELQTMRERLCEIYVEVGHAYPHKYSNLVGKSISYIDKVRFELDTIVCKENPNHEDNFKIYNRNIGIIRE